MNKSLGLTILFWLNFLVSPTVAYVMNGMTFFNLFDLGTLPFVRPNLMPWLMIVTFIWIMVASYVWVGILTQKEFIHQSVFNNRINKITVVLGIFEIILLMIGNGLRVMTKAFPVNDIAAITALPLLLWLNYQFWQSTNQNWVWIGLLIQSLCICLFMQGFYSSVW